MTAHGRKRLRDIAKICLDHGVRVQNSVFECQVDPAQWVTLKNNLLAAYNPKEDSLRFYFLGKHGRQKMEHYGAKPVADIIQDPLVIC